MKNHQLGWWIVISVNVAHPLLKEIKSELENDERVFSFLCGHDSNLGSVLAALDVDAYEAPEAIETKTPIGSKLVFEKWERNNEEYIRVGLVYNSVEQIRNINIMDLENKPMIYYLSFTDIDKNSDGMYRYEDFAGRLNKAINQYDVLLNKYCPGTIDIPSTGVDY